MLAGPGCALVEFGSGSSVKSRLLLEAHARSRGLCADRHLAPASRRHGGQAAPRLSRPEGRAGLRRLHGAHRAAGRCERRAARSASFPGSTIGNLEPVEATAFLRRARSLLGRRGALVLGVDLKKDPRRLHDAYNDSAGVTAEFTLNLLRRMNRELEANFDLAALRPRGLLQLRSKAASRSTSGACARRPSPSPAAASPSREGERVHTEYSYKYDDAGIAALARSAGFSIDRTWTDPDRLFAVVYLEARPLKQAARPRVSLETGYRSGGESGIAERGQGDTGTRPIRVQRRRPKKSCRSAPKNLIQRLSA